MLGVGNVVFLNVQSHLSLSMAALGVLGQKAGSAHWVEGVSSETPAAQTAARQMCLCLLLGTVQQEKSLLPKLIERFKKLLGSG